MSPYLITGIAALLIGAAAAAGVTHELDANHYGSQLSTVQAQLSAEKAAHANDLAAISKTALEAEQRAIDDHTIAEGKIATLDDQLTQEKQAHEADNARNRAAIAAGARRLRIAVSNFHPAGGEQASAGTGAGGMGDGSSGTAELSPAAGSFLFGIVDAADDDARAKAEYLQQYVCALQQQGMIEGTCNTTTAAAQ